MQDEESIDLELRSTQLAKNKRGDMELCLHRGGESSSLAEHYGRAFESAVELYIVSAYLTDWAPDSKLSSSCRKFRFIVGKDFGLTRKKACRDVLKWLPAARKADFMVADRVSGFHPKAAFWKDADGGAYMLMGSSNLSRAAFVGNVEANVTSRISEDRFRSAVEWINWIEERSVPVSDSWLEMYVEAQQNRETHSRKRGSKPSRNEVVSFDLPLPPDWKDLNATTRQKLSAYAKYGDGLERLFRRCANGKIGSRRFFEELPAYWGFERRNRLQGAGWERLGKSANFKEIAIAYLAIVDSSVLHRDDEVRRQLDLLHSSRNSARKAFLSEMLCLRFPDLYPVLNDPVRHFLADSGIRTQRGASEGASYIDLARKLRLALRSEPKHPARNLAELDHLIWGAYGRD